MQKLKPFTILITGIIFYGYFPLFCQNENTLWLLNQNVAFDFQTSPPNFVPYNNNFNGENESCVVVCHELTGQLLFYSDGYRIWNSKNTLMKNSSNQIENFVSTSQRCISREGSGENNTIYFL